jgi:hypothetical protein
MSLKRWSPWLALVASVLVAPVSATTRGVRRGEDLQRALDAAQPGDTILLERGAEYVGNFVLPARLSDDPREITLRTVSDRLLPDDTQRITPAYADNLAKLRSPNGTPALRTAPGARGWRVMLLELKANRNGAGDIVTLGDGTSAQRSLDAVPSSITLDRLYVHGDEASGQKRGIALNASQVTIRNCWISDIKAVGQDSQGIAGWNGPGDYLIENNYIEAAGENVLFGGADPSILGLTPTRIVLRRNLLSKQLAWHEQPGQRWQVKNLLELKNARSVIIERNVLERSWQQAQSGYAVLFTVRNQDGGCPWCQVEDITFRSNLVRDVAAGLQVTGDDSIHASRRTNGIVVAGNVFDRIDRRAWGGDGYFMLVLGGPANVRIDHNTIIQGESGGIFKMGSGASHDFAFTNNIAAHGDFGIIGDNHAIGLDSIRTYLPGARIERNVIAGGDARRYPAGNEFPSLETFVQQFADYVKRDYRLRLSSPWRGAGSDGRDLGADAGDVMTLERDMR